MPRMSRFSQAMQQQNHGIPDVPLIREKDDSDRFRPIIYREMDVELNLPFGVIQRRQQQEPRPKKFSLFLWCFLLTLAIVLLFALWYFWILVPKQIKMNLIQTSEDPGIRDSYQNTLISDLYSV